MKKKFIKFLKRKRVYTKFMRNFYNVSQNSKGFDDYCETTMPLSYVSCAFIWDMTPEEWKFWNSVDENWKKLLKP